MDRYFTIMLVPEREKGVKSFRIPRVIFHGLLFLGVLLTILLGILIYDYWKIIKQVYEIKHLTIENRQLKEQIQLFQMNINRFTEDLERVHTFERKLRIITGLDDVDLSKRIGPKNTEPAKEESGEREILKKDNTTSVSPQFAPLSLPSLDKLKNYQNEENYEQLKSLYELKLATQFGLETSYSYTKEWNDLTKQSFALADRFAEFDFKFKIVKKVVKDLEVSIHNLDRHLLDKESYLKSTPTLLPTRGWITSYYGPRVSPTSQRLRMHEGLDIGGKSGTPIVSSADGRISFAGIKPGFGKFVQIDHGYGIESFYAHCKKLYTKRGQIVKRGDLIASIGNTGASTGPHLHYEIRVNGTPVDPLYFVLD
jgi:murein DD-endopeptidase MepM/ murein hydrolase activator NlpD